MRYRILDADGDMKFGRGQQDLTYGLYAVAQAVKTRLLLLKNEWWEDIEDGLPLFQQILGQPGTNKNIAIVDSLIKERIIGTIDVTSIESFSSNYDNRSYSFTTTINTNYGTTTLSSTL